MNTAYSTRWRIVDALDDLMTKTPIDKIKVTCLCRAANVSRATFYDYFEDKYSVATWAWDQVLEESLYHIGVDASLADAHEIFFKEIGARGRFFSRAFRSNDYNSIMNYGYRAMVERYLDTIPGRLGRELTSEEAQVVRLYTAGAAFHTSKWAQDGMLESPDFMARTFALAAPHIFDCLQLVESA